MKQPIPEGTSIGEIETSLEWLLSHTSRFRGVILVRINTGEGFILIEYGLPVGFSFRMGDRVLQGAAARQFFERKDFIHASLRRYTDREFQEALDRAGPEILIPGAREGAQRPTQSSVSAPATTGTRLSLEEDRQGGAGAAAERVPPPIAIKPDLPEEKPGDGMTVRRDPAPQLPRQIPFEERIPESILDRIFHSPGVTAAAIFRERSIVDYRGEDSLEEMVETAEDILLTAGEILSLLSTGPLGQLTLRVSGTNVTIAPFEDGYFLILTEPEVNLGQIRKLVHDGACAGRG
jgi:predicted regulator of Ras-like GTPase activity (Roadblock/LC7/MglB family)